MEKIKVSEIEIIVTGKKEKPYFEIKYREVGKRHYNIGFIQPGLCLRLERKVFRGD